MNLVELYKSLNDESAAQQNLEIAQKQISALDEQGPSERNFCA